jgi:hypothetical protein
VTSTPPSTPPNGINDHAPDPTRLVTRPVSALGIRSKITAPMIGLMKPEANPPIAQMITTAGSGASVAKITNRGRPPIMKHTVYMISRGSRSPRAAAISAPRIEKPEKSASTSPTPPAP